MTPPAADVPVPSLVCLGETLVDFLPTTPGKRVADVGQWVPCPGGSPANVAIGVSRLGVRSAMVGVVGDDEFGLFLKQALAREGVDVSGLRQTIEARTGLVFISLGADGERTFCHFRTKSAELLLGAGDMASPLVSQARALHFGSNSLLYPEAQDAVARLVDVRKRSGALVSCDPNLRLGMWKRPEDLRDLLVSRLLPGCTVVKLAEDEIELVTGTGEPVEALRRLSSWGVALPVVTVGPQGAWFLWKGEPHHLPAPRATVVDTTGAGDGFMAALLSRLVPRYADRAALESAELSELKAMTAFACACAARVVEKLGAVAGLPTLEEVRPLLPTDAQQR